MGDKERGEKKVEGIFPGRPVTSSRLWGHGVWQKESVLILFYDPRYFQSQGHLLLIHKLLFH